MKDEEVLRQELEDVTKQKDVLLEEKSAILREAHLLKLRELQLKTLLKLEALYQTIEAITPEGFGIAFDLFQKSTTNKTPVIQVLIDFPKEEKEPERKPKQIDVIQEAVMSDEQWQQKAIENVSTLTDEKRYIVEIIGRNGISRNQELREFLEQDELGRQYFQKEEKFQYSNMSSIVRELKENGYLLFEKVDIGSKGGYNFVVYELSKLGQCTYELLTKQQVSTSEKQVMLAQYESLAFGYLRKDAITEFKFKEYEVIANAKYLHIGLESGRFIDIDLILEKEDEKAFVRIDVGNRTEEAFFEDMDNWYQLYQEQDLSHATFYFIAPSESILFGVTKRRFFLWVKKRLGGIEQVKDNMTVHFTTFDKIKKRREDLWETVKL